MEFTPVILEAVRMMNNYLPETVEVDFIDTEVIKRNGILGVTLLITCNKNEHRFFLKYGQAEDIMIYPSIIDGIMNMIIREDLENIITKYERKQKIKHLNELT
jgi:hypothetical protein